MNTQIAILGRLSALSLAELERRYGGELTLLEPGFVQLSQPITDPERYGGLMRLTEVIASTKDQSWRGLLAATEKAILEQSPEGKVRIAINPSFMKRNFRAQEADLLQLKKRLRKQGLSVRMIMPKDGRINAAQVKANKLAAPGNYEITPLRVKNDLLVLRTTWVQDVDDYAARDYERPKRDGFVGMLPPKLTQIMLNLAQTNQGDRVLDPFCGTGVVLQEALLMGRQAYGTDLADKMVDYSQKNLRWLRDERGELPESLVEAGDARSHQWTGPIDAVVCETYLGEPQTSQPSPAAIKQLRNESASLLSDFLTNLHPQIKPGTTLVLAIPAWRTEKDRWIDSPVIDSINRLGYTRTSLQHVSNKDLLYYRSDQYVARRILVLKRR